MDDIKRALMGDVPRIELFARERAPGWDAWGDEIQEDGMNESADKHSR